jgi:2-polyprenyl-3-methyl-5-hydroxy-6-metoxy-1,4-benzoquinol methylase
MQTSDPTIREKIRQQFDSAPYPRIPVDQSPKNQPTYLWEHSLPTAYYLKYQRVTGTKDKVILDAGCGSGFKSLALALANPGAQIVGVDLSEASVALARQRLEYHGFQNVAFHAMPLEELPQLGIEFDYINCDEVLYLLPDPVVGLQAMQTVLRPEGILRVNFHSALQRANYFQGQKFFKMVGLMDDPSQETQLETVRAMMRSLKDNVHLKSFAWRPHFETDDEVVLANYLLQGDKGWTIPEFFAALQAAQLEFISMVQFWKWDLLDLFQDLDELPIGLAMNLTEQSAADQLHSYELLNPVNRLLDLWCGHPGQTPSITAPESWTSAEWEQAQVHLHPLLLTAQFREALETCISQMQVFQISQYLPLRQELVIVDSLKASCLLLLTESSQPIAALVQRWLQLNPLNPITLEPTNADAVFEVLQKLLIQLESLGFLFLEKQ